MPVLNETDIYREFAPPPALRRSIACLWIRRDDGEPVRILPDGCSDIIWRPGVPAFVAGPDTSARTSYPRPGEWIVGVRFLPGAGGSALRWPLADLRDQRVPLSELGLADGLDDADEPERALAILAASAFGLAGGCSPDRAVQAAVGRLADPRNRVDRLAEDLGLSERQLRRRFLAAVGYGPKTLQRVLRLHRFLKSARTESLAGAAFGAGYADQAHLARECRALTGMTPRQLVGR